MVKYHNLLDIHMFGLFVSDTIKKGEIFFPIISLLKHIYTGYINFLSFPFAVFYCKKRELNSFLCYPVFPHSQLFWSHSSERARLSHQGKRWQDPCRDEAILN